jgi:hypothetical protein
MGRGQVLVLAAGVAVMWGAGLVPVAGLGGGTAARAGTVQAAGVWGEVTWVPGLGALNVGKDAEVLSVSCTSATNCGAGGYYRDRRGRDQGFVVSEKYGVWGRATEVPGLGALNQGGQAQVLSVSCALAGYCAAAGYYTGSHGRQQGFVVGEQNGAWGHAVAVPGPGSVYLGNGTASEVSCPTAADCTAGGSYGDSSGHGQGFVISEKNGAWGQRAELPGLEALNQGGSAGVLSVACASAGNCAAGGFYTDRAGHQQGFAAVEKNGAWGQATEVPGLEALNQGGSAQVLALSCTRDGYCAAGGSYTDNSGNGQGFAASEQDGIWRTAIEVPGLGALNAQTDTPVAYVGSVSCTAPGDCTADGDYGQPYSWAYAATQTNGTWGSAINIPGIASLGVGRWASAQSVSCTSPGDCAAGGDLENLSPEGDARAFVASQSNGHWSNATTVPGLGTILDKDGGDASVMSVSCGAPGHCTAAGYFTDSGGHRQGFVTRDRNPT